MTDKFDPINWLNTYAAGSAKVLEASVRENAETVSKVVDAICESLRDKGKTLFFGNGGSAADSQHLAAEFVNRYLLDRDELAAVALSTDTSVITSISNDYGYDLLFAKQVRALALPQDVAFGISTSGTSKNVLLGLEAARAKGCVTVGLCGVNPEPMAPYCDYVITAAAPSTPMIQQIHITIGHAICHLVELEMFGRD